MTRGWTVVALSGAVMDSNTIVHRDALLSSTTTIWWNSHARTPSPLVGRSRYSPKWQVQGDPVTLKKSSPN